MSFILDFDYGETRDALISLGKQFPEGSKEERAIRLAGHLLLYVSCDRRRLRAFRAWHEEGSLPYSSAQFDASHEFATQEEANAWRASGKATDGERVLIAGKGYEMVDVPPYGLRFMRVLTPEEWAQAEAEEELPEP
jgi:hypothetical protein